MSEIISSDPVGSVIVFIAIAGAIWSAGAWYSAVNADRTLFREFIDKIEPKIESIEKNISKIFNVLDPTAEGGSPRTLTKLGQKVSDEIGAKKWVGEFIPVLKDRAQGKEEYEIYEICNSFIREEHKFSEDEKRLIKATAYENAIEPDHALSALVIELRDRLLELENPS